MTMNDTRPPSTAVRLTRHREAVLTAIQARPMHLTAAEIYDLVRQRDPRIAYATIYNALHYLVETRCIGTVQRPDGVTCYDRATQPHEHVQCRACGALADVERTPALGLEASYTTVGLQTGYRIEQHRIAFVGLCPRCQAQGTAF